MGQFCLVSGLFRLVNYLSFLFCLDFFFQIKTGLSKSGGAFSPLSPDSYSPADPLQTKPSNLKEFGVDYRVQSVFRKYLMKPKRKNCEFFIKTSMKVHLKISVFQKVYGITTT